MELIEQDATDFKSDRERPMVATRLARRQSPVRILHVVSRMRRAGIETWLMHVLRNVDPQQFQMDFLVHSHEPADFDAEIRARGRQLLYAGPFRQLWSYGRRIREVLHSQPAYDVVHAHVDCLSGYSLKIAAEAGIPVRIAHCHNDLKRSFAQLRWSLKLLSMYGKSMVARHRTHGLATSKTAGETLFGNGNSNANWKVLPCGLNLDPYSRRDECESIRRELGIPKDSLVIGHVGRFEEQKNHRMVVRIAAALRMRTDKFRVVLVGDGALRKCIEQEVRQRGLAGYVTFTGTREDVPRLFGSLFDAFLFPSHFEGLGLVLVEAQAAGCPAVTSNVIPAEADLVPSLVTRLPLTATPDNWAKAIQEVVQWPRTAEFREHAHKSIVDSPFNIVRCVDALTSFYQRALAQRALA